MATTISQNDLDQNKNNNQDQSGQDSTQNQPGQQAPVGPQQTGQPGQQNTIQSYNPNKQQGSGYTNIQRIVQANQGNNLGQAVGQGIQKAGQQVSGQLGQAQNQFQQDTTQNTSNTDANNQLAQSVLANPDQYVDATGAQQTANGVKGNQFQQLLSGVYQGPQTLNNIQQLQGQASDVSQLNKAIGSAGGRMGLLQRFVGGPQYNSGQQTLDSLLLGKSGGQDLAQARLATAGLGQKVSGAEQGAEAQAQLQTGASKALGQQLQDQFGNTVSGIDTGLQKQATDAQTGRDTKYQQLLKDLQSGTMTQSEAANLGLQNGQEITSDMLNNLGTYVPENGLKASAQNIASAQDYARLNALRQLGGQNINTASQGILGQYQNQDKNAGAFNAAGVATPDQAGFNTASQNQLSQYHTTLDPVHNDLVTANRVNQLVQQRDAIAPGGLLSFGTSPEQRDQILAIQAQINQIAPGASGGNNSQGTGGSWTDSSWANNNFLNKQQKYKDTLDNLNSHYGTLRNLQINPDKKVLDPNATPTADNPSSGDLGLENIPKVQ